MIRSAPQRQRHKQNMLRVSYDESYMEEMILYQIYTKTAMT